MQDGEEAQLFQDPLFLRSETWKLSTSGLFRGEKFWGTGCVLIELYSGEPNQVCLPGLGPPFGTAMASNVRHSGQVGIDTE